MDLEIDYDQRTAPEISLKAQRWTLDDAAAAALKEGRCFRISLVLRADGVWQFRDGKRWKVTLPRLGSSRPSPSTA